MAEEQRKTSQEEKIKIKKEELAYSPITVLRRRKRDVFLYSLYANIKEKIDSKEFEKETKCNTIMKSVFNDNTNKGSFPLLTISLTKNGDMFQENITKEEGTTLVLTYINKVAMAFIEEEVRKLKEEDLKNNLITEEFFKKPKSEFNLIKTAISIEQVKKVIKIQFLI
jgi:hypothetical protein